LANGQASAAPQLSTPGRLNVRPLLADKRKALRVFYRLYGEFYIQLGPV